MVNAKTAESAAKKANAAGLPVGLHLNLTEGLPLSPPSEVSTLVDKDGFMLGKFGFRDALEAGALKEVHIVQEVRAQLKRFKELIPNGTHFDGHQVGWRCPLSSRALSNPCRRPQHVHVIPRVSSIIRDVRTSRCNEMKPSLTDHIIGGQSSWNEINSYPTRTFRLC